MYDDVPPPTTVLLTRTGFKAMEHACKRLSKDYALDSKNKKARISRNVLIEALLRRYGHELTLNQIKKLDAE